MPFSPKDKSYNPARIAALFNRELCALPEARVDASRLAAAPWVQLRGEGAELSCLRREGKELQLRLWESRGQHSRIRCVFANPIKTCQKTDATESWQTPLTVHGNLIDLKLKPFEIVTVRIEQ